MGTAPISGHYTWQANAVKELRREIRGPPSTGLHRGGFLLYAPSWRRRRECAHIRGTAQQV